MSGNAVFIGSIALALGVATVSAAAGVDAEDRAEAAAVLKAPITPTKAVQIAESDGGRGYALGMESTRKGNWYEVEVLRNDTPTEVRIDPVSGKVLGSGKAHGEDAANAHALDKSDLTLSAAIAQAERTGDGTAMEATSMGSGANASVIVDIVRGKQISHYRVSMMDSQIHAIKTSQGAG
ncbi:MAG TPA: PepSY domain-containing protein [Rhodanobacteraceae bacterium]|nr:PepSY domain-containing protein [Rhodanobacteraceae bacterium]